MIHETLHTLGIVAECAPNHSEGGHVSDDPRDLMSAASSEQTPSLDVGRDDYFGSPPEGCINLAYSVFVDPSVPEAAPPPGWPLTEVTAKSCDLACDSEGTIQSSDKISETTITFVNLSRMELKIFWLGSDGLRKPFLSSLPSNKQITGGTHASQVYLVADHGGDCIAIYSAIERPSKAYITN